MSHNNGGVTNLGKKIIFEFENSSSNDDEGGVGGLNYTLCLLKPLIIVSLSFESCVTSMMNLNPNMGIPLKMNSQKDDTLAMVQTKSMRMLNLLWFN
jgi:hypothetical protein